MTINHKELHITVTPDGHSAVTWHNLPEGEHVLCDGEAGQGVSEPDWTPCSERLPTESDEDIDGHVWGWYQYRNEALRVASCMFREDSDVCTHWKPTGLERPKPPESDQ